MAQIEITLYDYLNQAHAVGVDDIDSVERMFVDLLSGDEVVTLVYAGDREVLLDPMEDSRRWDFPGGSYEVPKDKIHEWANFKPSRCKDRAYARLKRFGRPGH